MSLPIDKWIFFFFFGIFYLGACEQYSTVPVQEYSTVQEMICIFFLCEQKLKTSFDTKETKREMEATFLIL